MGNKREVATLMQGETILVTVDGRSYSVRKGVHLNYDKVLDAMRDGDYDRVADLVDIGASIESFYNGEVEIKNGGVYYQGQRIHNALTRRLLQMYRDELPLDPLVRFLRNLMKSPSRRAIQELYTFLEYNNLPITSDGCFVAYKRVKVKESATEGEDDMFVDCYTGKINNNVGQTVKMERSDVDDDFRNTCSSGLHFCSMEYLRGSGYGGRDNPIVVVKIDPADVVSIPIDYNNTKGRCCRYMVISKHDKGEEDDSFDTPVVDSSATTD